MKMIEEMHVLVGLPASGKTVFANQYQRCISHGSHRELYANIQRKYNQYGEVINFDDIMDKVRNVRDEELRNKKIDNLKRIDGREKILILDGLFLTQTDVEWVIGLYLNDERFTKYYQVQKIIIDYWFPDRDACEWNDRGRRIVGSSISIRNLKIEKPDKKKIEEMFGVPTQLKSHTVVRKPDYMVFIDEQGLKGIHDGKYLHSCTWSLGGEAWGWNGDKYAISAEEPCNFDEFDNLLEQICPTITFLQYKKLYRGCITVEDRANSDYYSNTREAYYCCDLEKLWSMLEEMGVATLN